MNAFDYNNGVSETVSTFLIALGLGEEAAEDLKRTVIYIADLACRYRIIGDIQCRRDLTDAEQAEKDWTRDEIEAALGGWQLTSVDIQSDPRYATVKVILPNGASNHHDHESWSMPVTPDFNK